MTLTETAILTKRTLLIALTLSILGLATFLGYQYYYYNYYLPSLPIIEEQPELKFGLLPKIEFQDSAVASSNFTYTIDTKTGTVPEDLPNLLNVYFIPLQGTSLLAPDRAKELARNLKFDSGPDLISAIKYRFEDDKNGELIVDLDSGNFNFIRNIATPSGELALPDQTQIASSFKDFLGKRGLLKEQLISGRTKVVYDRASQQTSEKATVSLWQEDVDNIPIVTPSFKEGLIRAEVNKHLGELERYSSLDYIYWQIDKGNSSTYPLKSAKVALDELKNGLGNIVTDPKKGQVSITEIYLAYFLPYRYTQYLQPVYVFQGENFVAYVPAITKDQIEKEATPGASLKIN